jgi:hypothetical protein
MKEKYIASEEDIASVLLEMRSSNVDSMINIWNNISSKWSIDSVSQVHVSLYSSGHIQEMVSYILETRDIPVEDTAS